MKQAYIFPGQGSQFPGMGKALYENNPSARTMFQMADEILGFAISDIMFNGSDEDLRQTRVTQPAVFLHSVISAMAEGEAFAYAEEGSAGVGESLDVALVCDHCCVAVAEQIAL